MTRAALRSAVAVLLLGAVLIPSAARADETTIGGSAAAYQLG